MSVLLLPIGVAFYGLCSTDDFWQREDRRAVAWLALTVGLTAYAFEVAS